MVKDKFITQLPEKIFTRLCEEDETLTLANALKKAMIFETKFALKTDGSSSNDVNFVRSSQGQQYRKRKGNSKGNQQPTKQQPAKKMVCTRFGWKTHEASSCPYKDATCNTCSKKGHLSSTCRSKEKKQFNFIDSNCINSISNHNFLDTENSFDFSSALYSLSNDESSDVYWMEVSLGRTQMEIACDTGAPRTFVSKAFYQQHLSRFPIEQCETPYTAYGGHKLNLIGECYPSITYRGTSRVITVVVTNANAPPLLGRNFLRKFGFHLVQKDHVYSVDSIDSQTQTHSIIVNQIKDAFSNLFDGKLGKYNVCEISLAIDSDAKPIFCKPRALPFAWKETIEKNLHDLVEKGVIERIDSSQWGTPLVPIPKPDGDLRICGDYKVTINKFLVDVKYRYLSSKRFSQI